MKQINSNWRLVSEESIGPRERAKIKHKINLALCEHPEWASSFITGINGEYLEYCTECDKVTYCGNTH